MVRCPSSAISTGAVQMVISPLSSSETLWRWVKVTVLASDHPVFTWPNRLSDATWQGWVQERGLYFLGERDSAYRDLLEVTESFEYNRGTKRGALVEATVGHPQIKVAGGAVQLGGGAGGQVAVEPGQRTGGGLQGDRGVGDPLLDVLPLQDGLAIPDQHTLDGPAEPRDAPFQGPGRASERRRGDR